jgi:acyl carrier protein
MRAVTIDLMMSREDFLKKLDEILELPPGTVRGPEKLDDYPLWDSTAMISFMALADEYNGSRLTPRQIPACQTIEDLLRLAKVES